MPDVGTAHNGKRPAIPAERCQHRGREPATDPVDHSSVLLLSRGDVEGTKVAGVPDDMKRLVFAREANAFHAAAESRRAGQQQVLLRTRQIPHLDLARARAGRLNGRA